MIRSLAQRCEDRFVVVLDDDPCGVAPDGDDARAAESVVAHAKGAVTVIVERIVTLADPLARANVVEALCGPGGPAGVLDLRESGDVVVFRFDDAVTAAELIDDLVAIESVLVPERAPEPDGDDAAATMAAAGLGDPELDGGRILEARIEAYERGDGTR